MIACAAHGCVSTSCRNVRTRRGPLYVCSEHERMLKEAGEVLGALEAAPIGRASLLEDAPHRRPPPARPAPTPTPPRSSRPSTDGPRAHDAPAALPSPDTDPDTDMSKLPIVLDPDAPAERCRILGCTTHATLRGLCNRCYGVAYREGKLEEVARPPQPRVASVKAAPVDVEPPASEREVRLQQKLAGAQGELAFLRGELTRYKLHLDDIRCDILDTGVPLGDDTDRELTPRRLVKELLVAHREGAAQVEAAALQARMRAEALTEIAGRLARFDRPDRGTLDRVDAALQYIAQIEAEVERYALLHQGATAALDLAGVAGFARTPAERIRELADLRTGLRDDIARALGYSDGAGNIGDDALVDEVTRRLSTEEAIPLLTEEQVRAMVAELDAVAEEERKLEERRSRVLRGAA